VNFACWRSQAAASDNQGPQWPHITISRVLYDGSCCMSRLSHRRTDRKGGILVLCRGPPAWIPSHEGRPFPLQSSPSPKVGLPVDSDRNVLRVREGLLSDLRFCAHRVKCGPALRGLLAAARRHLARGHHGEHSSPRGAARNGSQNAGAKRLRLPAQRHPHCGAAERLPGGDASR
jgi:hypothetical protein